MRNTSFRFDIAAILLASVLTVLGISAASAGGVSGGVLGDRHGATSQHQAAGANNVSRAGGRGGMSGDMGN